eukprot:TRINITY_DN9064_c0_g1_i1.p1 TRINITY_DN9064_c0_g1~~TRINITY_DN9064_c0_g1_i1.p1  ORF type:complete len:328 (-),score=45.29 TRINITY_DN9064_c0_g1_i1:390-1310(-)
MGMIAEAIQRAATLDQAAKMTDSVKMLHQGEVSSMPLSNDIFGGVLRCLALPEFVKTVVTSKACFREASRSVVFPGDERGMFRRVRLVDGGEVLVRSALRTSQTAHRLDFASIPVERGDELRGLARLREAVAEVGRHLGDSVMLHAKVTPPPACPEADESPLVESIREPPLCALPIKVDETSIADSVEACRVELVLFCNDRRLHTQSFSCRDLCSVQGSVFLTTWKKDLDQHGLFATISVVSQATGLMSLRKAGLLLGNEAQWWCDGAIAINGKSYSVSVDLGRRFPLLSICLVEQGKQFPSRNRR